jgi:hypothetical protein
MTLRLAGVRLWRPTLDGRPVPMDRRHGKD